MVAAHPSLSIIIPCFAHSETLLACLRALELQNADLDFEVLVVDSASDPLVQAAAGQFRRARLLGADAHLFPGAARNLGVRNAASASLAFLDADCIPSPGWARHAHRFSCADGIITGGSIEEVQPVRAIAWCDNQMQFSDFRSGRAAGAGRHFPSCNLAMHREVFDMLGGFREDVLSGEDALFSQRAVESGAAALRFDPAMAVSHYGRATLRGLLEHQYSLGLHRGRLRLAFTPAWSFFARSPLLAGPALLWRYAYIAERTWRYSRRDRWRFLLCTPILLLGLAAWTTGFYQGLHSKRGKAQV